ncbi:hypothetical protein [Saccharopolyspora taberi]|uniref:ABM domain-containing protein n=1 Tax=Saccharopolyspora taberi TaxID=60895 RepID=A0ABN3V4M7_9PSEU
MKATVAHWDLSRSHQTIDTLRELLREEVVAEWAGVHGLRLKFWFADRERNLWGAVMLWESDADTTQPLPPNRAAELIGYPPTHRMEVEIEAAVEGRHTTPALTGLGTALKPA